MTTIRNNQQEKKGLLEELAAARKVFLSDLRLDPKIKQDALFDLRNMPDKEKYSLAVWGDTLSYLLGIPIQPGSYEQIQMILSEV